jgi:hypothetical protein
MNGNQLEANIEVLKKCVKYKHPASRQPDVEQAIANKQNIMENNSVRVFIPDSNALEYDIKSWSPHPPFSKVKVGDFIESNKLDDRKYSQFFTEYKAIVERNKSDSKSTKAIHLRKASDELNTFYKNNTKNVCLPLLFFSNMIVSPDLLTVDYIISNWNRNFFILDQKFRNIGWYMPYTDTINSSNHFIIDADCANLLKSNKTVMEKYIEVYMIFFDYLGYQVNSSGKTEVKDDSSYINILENITNKEFESSITILSKSLKTMDRKVEIESLVSGFDFWINSLPQYIDIWSKLDSSNLTIGAISVTEYKKRLSFLHNKLIHLKNIIIENTK